MSMSDHLFNPDRPAPIVRVRIITTDVDAGVTKAVFPESNRAATELMRRLLVVQLKDEGLTVVRAISFLPFNYSSYVFCLGPDDQVGRALRVIEDELKDIGLLPISQIGWFDFNEIVWRTHHPKGGQIVVPTEAEMLLEEELLQRMNELRLQILNATK